MSEIYDNVKGFEKEINEKFSTLQKSTQDSDKKIREELTQKISQQTEEMNKNYKDMISKLDSLERRIQQLEQKK
ncbi:MAG: hypothetical protein XXXJIFNMEKO3_02775 [Candidatus Erwinia impunctatus]|nr:hypothetical protein XXXJIFNMEKO_02775 [Culicoides impunctatus]